MLIAEKSTNSKHFLRPLESVNLLADYRRALTY
jgi:hypothetical protein